MLGSRLKRQEVDDVDDAHAQIGRLVAQEDDGGESFERGHVAGAGHDDFGIAVVVRGPLPDAEAGGAVRDGFVDVEPLRRGLLAGDDEVDVVAAAQAVVGDGEQAVGVRRQVDADDVGLLVDDMVDEAGILMGEAVVVLPPDVRGEQVVERGDGLAPRDAVA